MAQVGQGFATIALTPGPMPVFTERRARPQSSNSAMAGFTICIQ
ncbi:hypothetical protein CLV78_10295 [Aliiruegeria haliotis]|uniref:Uncharacterized protein n=1 Tax=Aliiruegeria haliotis TaxID=1280846 RepID=A0A2T0RUW8_9RHOB|nr:hypothetical protein CLV78_10295 [Aliiruegeria haliotis]